MRDNLLHSMAAICCRTRTFLVRLPSAKGNHLLGFEFEDDEKLLLPLEEPGLLERKKENMEEKRALAKRADWKRGARRGRQEQIMPTLSSAELS